MSRSSFKASWFPAGLLIILTFLAYAHALRCGWIWDDDSYVTDNPVLAADGGLRQIWIEPSATPQYYPMVFTSFWLEARLWGLDPAGFHGVNILLHALVAVLWWRVLRKVKLPGAWMAAAVFALHPVHVESVAWVTERKNVLSGAFYLMSLLAWLRFCSLEDDRSPQRRRWGWYGFALLLFVAALLSKTVTATLPAVIALGLWWKRGSLRAIGRRDGVALLPMFLIGIGFGVLTVMLEKHQVGAQGEAWDYTLIERCLIAGRVAWFYAGKLLWPNDLIFIYPRWDINAAAWGQWLYPLGALCVMFALWITRHRFGRGPLTAVLFFIGTLFPALGFFDVYPMRFSFVADHFQYLASMGLIALATGCIATLAARQRAATVVVSAVLLAGLGVRTWAQTHHYDDAKTLWTQTLQRNPDAWIAHVNLGKALHEEGDYARALELYQQAAGMKDDLPEAHRNIGEALMAMDDLEGAVPALRRAAELWPNDPEGTMSLAVAMEGLADRIAEAAPERAMKLYRDVLAILPEDVATHNKLARLLAAADDADGAILHFKAAVELQPNDSTVRYNLALTLARAGAVDEAMQHAKVARELDPESTSIQGLIEQIETAPRD